MPTILNDRNRRLDFQFGRVSGIRSTSDTVEQLQEQLRAERAQAELRRDLAASRLVIAQRATRDAFAAASSPSASVH